MYVVCSPRHSIVLLTPFIRCEQVFRIGDRGRNPNNRPADQREPTSRYCNLASELRARAPVHSAVVLGPWTPLHLFNGT